MRYERFLFPGIGLIVACQQPMPNATRDVQPGSPAWVVKTNAGEDSTQKIENENREAMSEMPFDSGKLYIYLRDSSMFLAANMRRDHRVFGYAEPDSRSERLLLLSIFTNDVEGNPFKCKLGSYYGTNSIENFKLHYLQTGEKFIKAVAIDNKTKSQTLLYFEKEWTDFGD